MNVCKRLTVLAATENNVCEYSVTLNVPDHTVDIKGLPTSVKIVKFKNENQNK